MITTHDNLSSFIWPLERLAEALETLAFKSRLTTPAPYPRSLPQPTSAESKDLEQWIQFAASQIGIEAEPVETTLREIEAFVRQSAPTVVSLPPLTPSDLPSFVLILKGGRHITLLTPDLKARRVAAGVLARRICQPILNTSKARSAQFFASVGVPEDRQDQVHEAFAQELYDHVRISTGWILRSLPSSPMTQHVRQSHINRSLAKILIGQIAIQILTLLAWTIISHQTLNGRYESIWLAAWALVLFTMLPIQLWVALNTGALSTALGALLKQRLIYGTLNLHPDQIRHEGVGHFLGRIMDSEVVESTTISNAFMTIMAAIQIISACGVFLAAQSGPLMVLMLIWIGLISAAGLLGYLASRDWYTIYRRMTQILVENMIGHRTRLAQEEREIWHVEEDLLVERYLHFSRVMDRMRIFQSAVSGTWLIAALCGLAILFAAHPLPLQALVASLGAVLLAQQALQTIQLGLSNTVNAFQAWQQIAPLFEAARSVQRQGSVLLKDIHSTPAPINNDSAPTTLMRLKNLSFRYQEAGRWILQNCNLALSYGDRVLLEGPSGGGKTTLAAIIAGLRTSHSGVIMLHNYDEKSLGLQTWRRHVVMAPQFHENHIFTETFAFNLLMGRNYPPTDDDLREAAQICQELGLSDLLNRMPSGFQQMVGESGWQLSHGERSRVFIARALLQNAEVIILDESFGALDSETLQLALECVLRRAATLIVIAHP